MPVSVAVIAVVVSGALAIVGAERRIPALTVVFKPLTTLLLFVVLGWPETTYAWFIAAGFVLSLVGDVALLKSGNAAFIVGLAAFLLGHLAYVIAFIGVAVFSWHVVAVAAAVLATTVIAVRTIWAGSAGMHGPVLAYAAVITTMVVTASATIGGPLPHAAYAAVGAALFYLSDLSLSLDRFWKPIPHGALLTMGVYWIGQLGIAWSARGG